MKELARDDSSSMADYLEHVRASGNRTEGEFYWEANDVKRRLHHLIDSPSDANEICVFIDKLVGQAKHQP